MRAHRREPRTCSEFNGDFEDSVTATRTNPVDALTHGGKLLRLTVVGIDGLARHTCGMENVARCQFRRQNATGWSPERTVDICLFKPG